MDDAVGGTAMTDSTDATPAREELRSCTYCLEVGADCCVRVVKVPGQPDVHEFAHRRCAVRKGVKPHYIVDDRDPVVFPWA